MGKIYSIKGGSSTAVQHLSKDHGIISLKTVLEESNKRRRGEEIAAITSSSLYSQDFGRYGKISHDTDIPHNL